MVVFSIYCIGNRELCIGFVKGSYNFIKNLGFKSWIERK